jgi:arylsulfatase A-like enzyme
MDGVRWQDVFGAGRDTLMPFLWNTVAKEGQLFGNRALGSNMRVANRLNFSYPGYQEMLAGYVDPRIDNNKYGPNPNVTVLEWLHRQPGFRGRVAAFANWIVFRDILARRSEGFLVSAGGPKGEEITPDSAMHAAALRHLREHKPRVLFVGYGETDHWAHTGRADRYRAALRDADRMVHELWRELESMPEYRGTTTLIITTDHGRGRGNRWSSHGWRTRGSGEGWLAIISPGTPALGERSYTSTTTSQVAATVAAALGFDYRASVKRAARPLASR